MRGWLAAFVWLAAVSGVPADPGARAPVDFKRDIEPILRARCLECHGPAKQRGGYRLDNRAGAVESGDSGRKGIVPGKSADSQVVARVRGLREKRMPPKGEPLDGKQAALLARWIDSGAPYGADTALAVASDHWAFRKPTRPDVSAVKSAWVRTPIDAFILSRLEKAGLRPNPEADRPTLLRRLSLDITGLPPTPGEVAAFANDFREGALERQVDRLLASPRFGERMARPWLDLARYADSKGYGSDPLRPYIWRYRDWVIDAYNSNLPFDRFTIEQLAGDLLPDATDETRLATAFHRNTMTNTEGGTDDEEFRVAAVKDRVDTTAQVWMALTLGCAKCHSHKFDPVTQREYYQVFAIFNQTEDSDHPEDLPRLSTPTADQARRKATLVERIASARASLAQPAPMAGRVYEEWKSRVAAAATAFSTVNPRSASGTNGAAYSAQDGGYLKLDASAPATTVTTLNLPDDLAGTTALRLEVPRDGVLAGGNVVIGNIRLERAESKTAAARYLRLELPGTGKMIHIAEAQVFRGKENIARNGKATQSSTGFGGDAARGIDGNTDGHYQKGSVTHTLESDNPWWEVDLGAEGPVDRVVIFNRVDGGLHSRADGLVATLLDGKRQPVWRHEFAKAPKVSASLSAAGDPSIPVESLSATFEQDGFPAAMARGAGGSKAGWAIGGGQGRDQALVMALARPLEAGPHRLVITQEYGNKHVLHRFRVMAARVSPPPVVAGEDVVAALARAPGTWNAAEQSAVRKAWNAVAPRDAGAIVLAARLEGELKALEKEIVSTPVMRELPEAKKRQTQIMLKGNFLTKGEAVNPAAPGAFHAPAAGPMDRLGFARWLVSPENPMTARVAANRMWALVFGRGIVESEEDFGIMGAKPTHPELLDWLATEYIRLGWDTKAFIRLLVLSAVYRQGARVEPDHLRLDPRNELLARFPRQRLEAEMVRDQALAVSGLLSGKVGGPSVFPPQPGGLWQAAFNGERTYPTSTGEDRFRRGIYSFWRRTVPPPGMQAFDAPSRESCTVRRIGSNTPLQAFVTMNDPVFVECAQALARRMILEGGADWPSRLDRGWRLCLGRAPAGRELESLAGLLEAERRDFATRPAEAAKLAGPAELPPGTTAADVAAATVVANVLLNMDAFLTRN